MGIGAAVGIAGAAISAGVGAATKGAAAKKAGKAGRKAAQLALDERTAISETTKAEIGIATQQRQAAEETRLRVGMQLGAPGTYGPEAGPTSGLFGFQPGGVSGMGSTTVPGGLWGETQKISGKEGVSAWAVEGQVMDPSKMASAIMSKPGARAVSGMVAEANQLMNRQGPLWEELNNSVTGSIYESAASSQRQQMEEISRMMAGGGSARRQGLAMAQRFKVQEDVNKQRMGALWQSRMKLEEFRVKQAQSNLTYAEMWTNNQAGIRDHFTTALTNLRTMWTSQVSGNMIGAASGSEAVAAQAQSMVNDANLATANSQGQAISGALESMTGALQKNLANPDVGIFGQAK